jgi:hypothetical protein
MPTAPHTSTLTARHNGGASPPVAAAVVADDLDIFGEANSESASQETSPQPHQPAETHLTGTIFDNLDNLVLDTNADLLGTVAVLSAVSVRKPGKFEFVRTHATLQFTAATIQFEGERQTYLVTPAMLRFGISRQTGATLGTYAKQVLLVFSMSSTGAAFFWPISLAESGGAWVTSARRAAIQARDHWTNVVANMKRSEYEVRSAEGHIDEPVWPDKTLNELLALAFDNLVIDSPDHAAIQRLRGITPTPKV